MKWKTGLWAFSLVVASSCSPDLTAAERINHAGRILGPTPVVTNAVLFNTPQADAIVSQMQILPRDNAWNEDISRRPLLSNSAAMISQIISDLASDRRTLRPFKEMNFVLVPDHQPLKPINFFQYPNESDPGPYPIPPNLPVESWPSETAGQSLDDWQRDINGWGGDRHSIIVQPGAGRVWETWRCRMLVANNQTNWEAANGARFSLTNNALRPAGWTSADAAGLSMFAGLVRYDECDRGMVEHAMRIIVKRTRRHYVYPATHYAATDPATSINIPAMGQRLRLKSAFVIPSSWTRQEKAVLRGLQKYGAIVADNGNFFSISVAPDDRFPANAFSRLSSISITNFEVIQTTGPTEGPRSPGAPQANAGVDQTVTPGSNIALRGAVQATGTNALAVQWQLYSGPTNAIVNIVNATQTNATATLTTPGTYTFMLSADDQLHAVAFDAVTITVAPVIHMEIARGANALTLRWTGGAPPYRLEQSPSLVAPQWTLTLTTNVTTATLPIHPAAPSMFYRVSGP